MATLMRHVVSINLATLILGYSFVGHALPPNIKSNVPNAIPIAPIQAFPNNRSFFNVGLLYLQPNSDNLKYATFVSGNQPYEQSWHYQAVRPDYHPTFELGFNYAFRETPFNASINWLHLNTNDSSSKQASTNTDLSTVEFVGPPYEMSPPVFGIKHVNSKANFDFDSILLNVGKLVEYDPRLSVRFFGGLNIVRLNQTITTTFSDYAGSPATPYSYPLPPDPSFSFETKNNSKFLGAGPDAGLSVRYKLNSGFGVMGDFLGLLAFGTVQTNDKFTSTSERLTNIGIGTSHQEITAPNASQVVLGADGKLGIFYDYQGTTISNLTIEAGWRMASYLNAISTVRPNTLVQPGTVVITPEFSTGTMAIVSTSATSHPFNFSGPFVNVKIDVA